MRGGFKPILRVFEYFPQVDVRFRCVINREHSLVNMEVSVLNHPPIFPRETYPNSLTTLTLTLTIAHSLSPRRDSN